MTEEAKALVQSVDRGRKAMGTAMVAFVDEVHRAAFLEGIAFAQHVLLNARHSRAAMLLEKHRRRALEDRDLTRILG